MTNVFEGSDGDVAAAEPDGQCTCTSSLSSLRDCVPHGRKIREVEQAAVKAAEQERVNAAVLQDAFRRWEPLGPVGIQLQNRAEAYLLMALLQLTTRHPANPFSKLAEQIGRQLQDAVCDREDIYALAEAGWNPECDQ